MDETVTNIGIYRFKDNQISREDDVVVKEVPLTICCNNVEIATLLCTPEHEDELAVGFLAGAGLIEDVNKIKNIICDKKEHAVFIKYEKDNAGSQSFLKRYITTGCGFGSMLGDPEEILASKKYEGNLKLYKEDIFLLMKELQALSQLYLKTGGVHSAALTDGKKISVFREDIGRHNAVDKIIGHALLNSISLGDKVLMTSGRISSEFVLKLAKAGIGCIISRSASMDRAVEFARVLNMTVIGFVRGRRMNIYTGEGRIRGL